MASTTIKVSKRTLRQLEELKRKKAAGSLEQVITLLLQANRRRILSQVFGADQGRVKPFTEEDRGEDRS